MFTQEQREIFRYSDGQNERSGDPILIEERYNEALASVDAEELDRGLKSEFPPERALAAKKLLPAIRAAFRLQPFDEDSGQGLTQAETLDLLGDWLDWCQKKRPSTAKSQSTPEPTDGPQESNSPSTDTSASI